jgi:hypothetical protein
MLILAQLRRLSSSPAAKRLGSLALACWFAYFAWQVVGGTFTDLPYHLDTLGIDGRIYYRAGATLLAGGDPWSAYASTNTWPPSSLHIHFFFTGPPPTALAFAPFGWIPETPFLVGWMLLTLGAAIYTLRRLKLPIWWLLFPPLVQGILAANPHILCLALLLSGSSWLRALAVPMKAYAVIPMVTERQWRAIALVAVGAGVSLLVFWPLWAQYVADYAGVSDWIAGATHGGFSATRDPRLWAVTAVAIGLLATVDQRAAGWLAVPALWPDTQYFYATFALPLRSPWLAAALALAWNRGDALTPWLIVAYSAIRLGRGRVWGKTGNGRGAARRSMGRLRSGWVGPGQGDDVNRNPERTNGTAESQQP